MALLEVCDIDFLVDERFFVSGTPSDEGVAEKFQDIVSELSAEQIKRVMKYAMDGGSFFRLFGLECGVSTTRRGLAAAG